MSLEYKSLHPSQATLTPQIPYPVRNRLSPCWPLYSNPNFVFVPEFRTLPHEFFSCSSYRMHRYSPSTGFQHSAHNIMMGQLLHLVLATENRPLIKIFRFLDLRTLLLNVHSLSQGKDFYHSFCYQE